MKIPWEQSESGILPIGTYKAKVSTAEMIESHRGGRTVQLKIAIASGAHAGRTVVEYFDINDDDKQRATFARQRLQIVARCAGIDGRDYELRELVGAGLEILTRHIDTQSGPRARVARYNPLPLGAKTDDQGDHDSVDMPF